MSSSPLNPPVLEEAAVKIAAGQKSRLLMAELGISRNTLSRWKARDDFSRRVCELRAEMTRESCGRVVANMAEAVDTMSSLLKADDDRVKLRAAAQILMLGPKLRESIESEERLRAPEAEPPAKLPQTSNAHCPAVKPKPRKAAPPNVVERVEAAYLDPKYNATTEQIAARAGVEPFVADAILNEMVFGADTDLRA